MPLHVRIQPISLIPIPPRSRSRIDPGIQVPISPPAFSSSLEAKFDAESDIYSKSRGAGMFTIPLPTLLPVRPARNAIFIFSWDLDWSGETHSFFMCFEVIAGNPPTGLQFHCDQSHSPHGPKHPWIAQSNIFYPGCTCLVWMAISSFTPFKARSSCRIPYLLIKFAAPSRDVLIPV